MKKVILLLLLIPKLIFTQDFSNLNLSIVNQEEIKGETVVTLQDDVERKIVVTFKGELDNKQIDLIDTVYETLLTWEEVVLKESRIIFEKDKMNIIILPESITFKEMEISQYMPSGMQFYFKKFFEYDFRMFKDNLFMRMKGQYFSKDEFLEEIYNAANDPILYIQIHDPSYLIRQIDLLRDVNNEQSKNIFELQEMLAELAGKHDNLVSRHDELLEKHENLQGEKDVLAKDTQELSYATIAINNKGFFGGLSQYDQKLVDRAIEVKTANSSIDIKTLATQLKGEGFKVSNKVLEAVFMIYFNEFPQNK